MEELTRIANALERIATALETRGTTINFPVGPYNPSYTPYSTGTMSSPTVTWTTNNTGSSQPE